MAYVGYRGVPIDPDKYYLDQLMRSAGAGAKAIPGSVYNYATNTSLPQLGKDIANTGRGMWQGFKEDPVGFALDATPIVGEIRSGIEASDINTRINQARAIGDIKTAKSLEQQLMLAMAGAIPLAGLAGRLTKKASKAASATEGAVTRGILGTPDLRTLSTPEAVEAARLQPHLIQSPEGQYVGAPRGMTNSTQIENMRKEFDAEVAAGAAGGDWYDRARKFNVEVEGDNPYRQRLAANEQALWSAQANPDTNMGFALNARTDYEAGKPKAQYRTGQQARSYISAREARDQEIAARSSKIGHNQGPAMEIEGEALPSGLARLGKKTGVYGQHLDPTVPPATTGTNDIWHARSFGYTNNDGSTFSRALSPQEHRFLDYETMLGVDRANAANLAGRSNWTGAEVQAAPWVAGKGRSLARGGKTFEQGLAEAAKTYPDVAPKYTVSTPIEQIPGASTGLMSGLLTADDATKARFTQRADWKDPQGRDMLWSEMGLPTRYTNDALGLYKNSAGQVEYNPVEIGRPLTGFTLNKAGNPVVNPNAEALFSAGQATRGLLDFQEGTPWNKIITHGAGPDKTSLEIKIGRNPTKTELESLNAIAEKNGYMLSNTEGGVAFLNFKDGQTTTSVGKELRQGLQSEISKIVPDAEINRGRFAGDYFDISSELSKSNAGKGLATERVVSELTKLKDVSPQFYERLLDSESIPKKARENLTRLIEFGGKGERPDYERLLKIVGEDKLRGLLKRIEQIGYQGLPAVVGAAGIGGGLLGSYAPTNPEEQRQYD